MIPSSRTERKRLDRYNSQQMRHRYGTQSCLPYLFRDITQLRGGVTARRRVGGQRGVGARLLGAVQVRQSYPPIKVVETVTRNEVYNFWRFLSSSTLRGRVPSARTLPYLFYHPATTHVHKKYPTPSN